MCYGLTRYDALSEALGKAMRRRSRAGSKSVNERHRKAAVQKRPTAPKVRARVAPVPDRETEVAKLTRERNEALEQLSEALERQTATSEVLRVISSSPGEQPVFRPCR